MPETTQDSTIILATSWQALGRAEIGDERTMICNCTVVIVFAAFYIEANLNHIIERLGRVDDLYDKFGPRPGLQDKLAWLYIEYCPAEEIGKKKAYKELRKRFPGFDEIYKFRNDVSHGVINRELANLVDAQRLRGNAKEIVADLLEIAKQAGCEIERNTTYEFAISSKDVTTG
jgi:hypothetical protein